MTIAILQYEVAKGKSKSLKVRPRQSVLIGASNSADIRLYESDGVAAQHCEVKFDKGKFEIFNLTGGKKSIRVNGTKVESTDLQDGDCIEIGKNKLTVVLQGETEQDSKVSLPTATNTTPQTAAVPSSALAVPVEQTEVEADAASTDEPVFTACANGLRTIELDSFEKRLHPIFKERTAHWDYCVLFNHLASKVSGPAPDSDKIPNLLDGMPEDITKSNDLFYETAEDEKVIFKRFRTYAEKKAAVLGVMKKKTEEADVAKELKFIATWLMNPEGLKFNLLNGTEFLISKIFTYLDVLVFYDADKKQDLVMFTDLAVGDWDAFVQWAKEYTHVTDR